MLTVITRRDVVDDRYLRMVDTPEVRAVMALIREEETMMRTGGFSKDKEIQRTASYPTQVYNHPALRHIFHNPDPEASKELRKRFLQQCSAFRQKARR